MNYDGRIIVTLFVIINYIVIWSIGNHQLNYFHLISLLFFCAIGWWLGKQYDRAKFFSERDELTNIYNRRFVQRIAPKLLAFAQRKNKKLCVSIIDVDNFKTINDIYGHETGDRVLHYISFTLVKVTRERDIVARWGGDEMLIISPFMKKNYPKWMGQRIDHKLSAFSQKINVNVSVSIGTAIFPDDGTSFNELVKKADKNMYAFKSSKKNNCAKIN